MRGIVALICALVLGCATAPPAPTPSSRSKAVARSHLADFLPVAFEVHSGPGVDTCFRFCWGIGGGDGERCSWIGTREPTLIETTAPVDAGLYWDTGAEDPCTVKDLTYGSITQRLLNHRLRPKRWCILMAVMRMEMSMHRLYRGRSKYLASIVITARGV
jgi:hypothetical protein